MTPVRITVPLRAIMARLGLHRGAALHVTESGDPMNQKTPQRGPIPSTAPPECGSEVDGLNLAAPLGHPTSMGHPS